MYYFITVDVRRIIIHQKIQGPTDQSEFTEYIRILATRKVGKIICKQ
jgi:hypothetical protein